MPTEGSDRPRVRAVREEREAKVDQIAMLILLLIIVGVRVEE